MSPILLLKLLFVQKIVVKYFISIAESCIIMTRETNQPLYYEHLIDCMETYNYNLNREDVIRELEKAFSESMKYLCSRPNEFSRETRFA